MRKTPLWAILIFAVACATVVTTYTSRDEVTVNVRSFSYDATRLRVYCSSGELLYTFHNLSLSVTSTKKILVGPSCHTLYYKVETLASSETWTDGPIPVDSGSVVTITLNPYLPTSFFFVRGSPP